MEDVHLLDGVIAAVFFVFSACVCQGIVAGFDGQSIPLLLRTAEMHHFQLAAAGEGVRSHRQAHTLQDQGIQQSTAAERPLPKLQNLGGDGQLGQISVAGEGIGPNIGQTLREKDTVQAAILEGVGFDSCYPRGDVDAQQCSAALKGGGANGRYTLGNGHGIQLFTAGQQPLRDGGQISGQHHPSEARAAQGIGPQADSGIRQHQLLHMFQLRQGILPDLCNIFGNGQRPQATGPEGRGADGCQGIGQHHRRQVFSLAERIITDGGNALRHRHPQAGLGGRKPRQPPGGEHIVASHGTLAGDGDLLQDTAAAEGIVFQRCRAGERQLFHGREAAKGIGPDGGDSVIDHQFLDLGCVICPGSSVFNGALTNEGHPSGGIQFPVEVVRVAVPGRLLLAADTKPGLIVVGVSLGSGHRIAGRVGADDIVGAVALVLRPGGIMVALPLGGENLTVYIVHNAHFRGPAGKGVSRPDRVGRLGNLGIKVRGNPFLPVAIFPCAAVGIKDGIVRIGSQGCIQGDVFGRHGLGRCPAREAVTHGHGVLRRGNSRAVIKAQLFVHLTVDGEGHIILIDRQACIQSQVLRRHGLRNRPSREGVAHRNFIPRHGDHRANGNGLHLAVRQAIDGKGDGKFLHIVADTLVCIVIGMGLGSRQDFFTVSAGNAVAAILQIRINKAVALGRNRFGVSIPAGAAGKGLHTRHRAGGGNGHLAHVAVAQGIPLCGTAGCAGLGHGTGGGLPLVPHHIAAGSGSLHRGTGFCGRCRLHRRDRLRNLRPLSKYLHRHHGEHHGKAQNERKNSFHMISSLYMGFHNYINIYDSMFPFSRQEKAPLSRAKGRKTDQKPQTYCIFFCAML